MARPFMDWASPRWLPTRVVGPADRQAVRAAADRRRESTMRLHWPAQGGRHQNQQSRRRLGHRLNGWHVARPHAGVAALLSWQVLEKHVGDRAVAVDGGAEIGRHRVETLRPPLLRGVRDRSRGLPDRGGHQLARLMARSPQPGSSRRPNGLSGCTRGSVIENTLPTPGVLVTSTVPPWACTSRRVSARPRPAPWWVRAGPRSAGETA